MLRWILSHLAASIPIFGGTSTRIEVLAVRVASCLSRMISSSTRVFPVHSVSVDLESERLDGRADWWSRQVEDALHWLQEEETSRRANDQVVAEETAGEAHGIPIG